MTEIVKFEKTYALNILLLFDFLGRKCLQEHQWCQLGVGSQLQLDLYCLIIEKTLMVMRMTSHINIYGPTKEAFADI